MLVRELKYLITQDQRKNILFYLQTNIPDDEGIF